MDNDFFFTYFVLRLKVSVLNNLYGMLFVLFRETEAT